MVGLAPEIAERRSAAIEAYELAVKEAREQLAHDRREIDQEFDQMFDEARARLEAAETSEQFLGAKAHYDETRARPRPTYELAQAKYDKVVAEAALVLHAEIALLFGRD
jgi:hypothetical protein